MDRSYDGPDGSEQERDPDHVTIFNDFRLLRDAHLLIGIEDLYWTAVHSGTVHLTPQGKLLWRRAKRGDF